MKKAAFLLTAAFAAITTLSIAQPVMKEYKAGHVFYVSLPEYMSKTYGLNSSSVIQYKSVVKDVYGFIIEDNKEELGLAEMHYSSLKEFYEDFIKDFLKDESKRKISAPVYKKVGDISFVECDATYYDNEAKSDIYYLVGIVETKDSFYKVLSWAAAENKEKFKADFEKILYSVRD